MARKKAGEAATPRKKKRAEKMPEGTFAAKLRIGPVTEAHMTALATHLGKKPRKTTRNDMKAFLTAACTAALGTLAAMPVPPAAAVQDDLLS